MQCRSRSRWIRESEVEGVPGGGKKKERKWKEKLASKKIILFCPLKSPWTIVHKTPLRMKVDKGTTAKLQCRDERLRSLPVLLLPPLPSPLSTVCVCVNQHSIANASANGECRWCAGHDAKPRRKSAKTLRRAYKSSYGGETKRRRDEETCTMWSFQD